MSSLSIRFISDITFDLNKFIHRRVLDTNTCDIQI